MSLPPLQEVLAIVEYYLSAYNSVIPLFHGSTLLRHVLDWYSHPLQRAPVVWAAINVAMALACQPNEFNFPTVPTHGVMEYLRNAESVLAELVMGDLGLLNVQVLAGLVMFYRGTSNFEPSIVLTATALRLAHRLSLHTRKGSEGLDASTVLQRNRVFWIVYILDKDVCLRTQNPPLQPDTEMDLDLPPEEPDSDSAGFFFAADGQFKISYFRARVQLARIQGEVYNAVYSTWAYNARPDERSEKISGIIGMLSDWSARIPPAFSASAIPLSGRPTLLRPFCLLYATRLTCWALLLRANYMEMQWVARLQEYGKHVVASGGSPTVPDAPLPDTGWQPLVEEARDFLWLFVSIPQKDLSLIWYVLPLLSGSLFESLSVRR
jgi:hypothetical protein